MWRLKITIREIERLGEVGKRFLPLVCPSHFDFLNCFRSSTHESSTLQNVSDDNAFVDDDDKLIP